MKKHVVITSIFEPTTAVKEFALRKDLKLIVVGDKKTPSNWSWGEVKYLSLSDQESIAPTLSKTLPYNHYCRKMVGYVQAIHEGAELIIDTDDDNIPKGDWAFPPFEGNFLMTQPDMGFVNTYQFYTDQPIWPRGFPLNLIKKQFELDKKSSHSQCEIGVWQGLADEDPDVDAIYRLTSDQPCYFSEKEPLVLGKKTFCSFNSQNTAFRKELFSLLYLPTSVTFRFTDILRGLVAIPIMELYGFHLGFTKATVVQKRNPHDYFKDFLSEIPMFQTLEKSLEVVQASVTSSVSVENNLRRAYSALKQQGIVFDSEMLTLDAWLKAVG